MAFDSTPARDLPLSETALDQLFTAARTRNAWSDRPVSEDLMRRLYDLTKFGPTAVNNTPARFVFVTSPEAKARLVPLMSEGNQAKTLQAPVAVIIGYDMDFHETLPRLFPHAPGARDWFADAAARRESAFRNSSLQGGYFMIAARALGLDVGPMSGFDAEGVKAEFFAGTAVEPNFIVNLGYGTDENLFPRSPRLGFEEAARII
ncbi:MULTISPECIES: malonic semialdehyde reductase [unclassified Brevundimonas]|uniref:malonic semialdehyde reductase n=1 Tax=unclassified Brevundimonas TaxID=2622653 RepID=UPI0006F9C956|nr:MULTISPECIES: malonic semialdehyde reductase [unclassified Brevundimonas]KQY76788.1 malonic semialdehyde reductase [Brevundimonas sp. Root1423]KRA27902.1 malonic semialdehyde reductase [Brevundimonas sp. Root608]